MTGETKRGQSNQEMEKELDRWMEEYYCLREGVAETHPQVQYIVAEYRRRLRAYETAMAESTE